MTQNTRQRVNLTSKTALTFGRAKDPTIESSRPSLYCHEVHAFVWLKQTYKECNTALRSHSYIIDLFVMKCYACMGSVTGVVYVSVFRMYVYMEQIYSTKIYHVMADLSM